jgi:hypothetical protein
VSGYRFVVAAIAASLWAPDAEARPARPAPALPLRRDAVVNVSTEGQLSERYDYLQLAQDETATDFEPADVGGVNQPPVVLTCRPQGSVRDGGRSR